MLSRATIAMIFLAAPIAAFTSPTTADSAMQNCKPLETAPANVPEQQPAFPGQTRACEATSNVDFDVVVMASGLEHPWAVEPLPDGDVLITERPGRMRIVSSEGKIHEPLAGVPEVFAQGQGGLLDVTLSPDFKSDRTIFFSYSEPRDGGNATSVARAVLSDDRKRLEAVKVIFRALPVYDGDKHYGSRLAFDADGMLYVTLGERSDIEIRPQAQDLDSHMGKIVRIAPDGSVPKDNPFVNKNDALPEIWTLGHRNVQSAAFDSDGELWIVDHGAQGGDEINLVEKGKNYGWPLVAYGEEYTGEPIETAKTQRPGFEQPIYYWDPVIAPSGAQFYDGDAFVEWQGSLFIGGLKERELVRIVLDDGKVIGEEHLLGDRGQRIRDVRQGPNGALFVVTDEDDGELWRIEPRN